MENPEDLLQSLEEFSKSKPRDIPRELEEYLCFVAKTGDPVYQWPTIKSLFREKLINVITEFYESCASVDIPACPNVELFNYDTMKNFILEKLDTFVAAPFTVQRICELLTAPRKEYNRIDKYMRALEKNILVVSTTEPGSRHGARNGDSVMNGIDSEHIPESSHCNDINVEEMDDSPSWKKSNSVNEIVESSNIQTESNNEDRLDLENKEAEATNTIENTVITPTNVEQTENREPYVSIEPVVDASCNSAEEPEPTSSVTITAVPAGVQNRRSSVENEVSSETTEDVTCAPTESKESKEEIIEECKEAENKVEDIVKDEDRIILTSTDSGIENISPESSTSSPENLQTEFESCSESSTNQESKLTEAVGKEQKVDEPKPEPALNEAEPKPENLDEVSSSVSEIKDSPEASMDVTEQTDAAKPNTEGKGDESKNEASEKNNDVPMDVDSSSDKIN